MSEHAYDDAEHGYAHGWRRIHANGEQTHVVILERDGDYQVVAWDIDPRDWSAVAAEAIAYEPTLESAAKKAETWMRENPKGIAEERGGGIGSRVVGVLAKLNEYGNEQVETMQQGESDTE